MCSYHHIRVHEGGCTIEHVEENTQQLNEQFIQQQHNDDINQFDFEQSLRNDKESFNTVRKLSLTRYRYRFLDAHGQVITGRSNDDPLDGSCDDSQADTNQSTNHFRDKSNAEALDSTRIFPIESIESIESTRVDNNDATRAGTINQTGVNFDNSTPTHTDHHSTTRCGEAIPEYFYRKKSHSHAQGHTPAFTYETPSSYGMIA